MYDEAVAAADGTDTTADDGSGDYEEEYFEEEETDLADSESRTRPQIPSFLLDIPKNHFFSLLFRKLRGNHSYDYCIVSS